MNNAALMEKPLAMCVPEIWVLVAMSGLSTRGGRVSARNGRLMGCVNELAAILFASLGVCPDIPRAVFANDYKERCDTSFVSLSPNPFHPHAVGNLR